MDWLPDAPAVVLVALSLAAVLFLVEAALPTFGVAGSAAFALAVLGVLSAADQDLRLWPLVATACGASLWAVLLFARRSWPPGQLIAVVLFGAGSIGFGLLARDGLTVALAVADTALMPLLFAPLSRATGRLMDLPAQTGMGAMVGHHGAVVRWEGERGSVRVDGSLWNAAGAGTLSVGDEIVVIGHHGMTVDVAPLAIVP